MNFESFREALNTAPLPGFCAMYATPGIIERIGRDWAWCWIDTQHGEWGAHDVVQAVRACNLVGIFALVRVPGHDATNLGKVLDTACHAVMVPMVNHPEQARALVEAVHFPPLGRRSYGGRRPVDLYGRGYASPEGARPLLVCQIESPAAVEQADAIAAVEGVDALFFGPDDMALAGGMDMEKPRAPDHFDRELKQVADAARRHGKIAGGIFRDDTSLKKALALGYRLLVCSGDVVLLTANAEAAARAAWAGLAERGSRRPGASAAL